MTNETRRVRKKQATSAGGLEMLVDSTAFILLIVGLICSLIPLLTFNLLGVLACASGCFIAYVQWLLFRCVAELIRLLKYQNGLPFSGTITSAIQTPIYTCEICGMMLHSSTYCDGCGAKIIGDADDPTNGDAVS